MRTVLIKGILPLPNALIVGRTHSSACLKSSQITNIWPKRHSRLGASLHLTPRVKYGRYASVVGAGLAGSPFFGRYAPFWQVAARQPNLRWEINR